MSIAQLSPPPHARPFTDAVQAIGERLADERFGFVATAASLLHALSVDAWLLQQADRGDTRTGLILLAAPRRSEALATPEHFPFSRTNSRVQFLTVQRGLHGTARRLVPQVARLGLETARMLLARRPRSRNAPPIYLVTPRTPDFFTLLHSWREFHRRNRPVEFVCVDEGLTSFVSRRTDHRLRRAESRSLEKSWLARQLDVCARTGYHQFSRVLARRYPLQRLQLFQERRTAREPLAVDQAVAGYYRRVIAQARQQRCASRLASERTQALIVTQPWSEARELRPNDELRFLGQVIESLNAYGYDAAVKPHPRERANKYAPLAVYANCRILAQSQPVETLFAELSDADLVLGYNSTSLLTAHALFGLKVYTVGAAISDFCSTGAAFRELQTAFERLSGDMVQDFRALEVPMPKAYKPAA